MAERRAAGKALLGPGLLDRERSLSDAATDAAGGVEWPFTGTGRLRRPSGGKVLPERAVPPGTETCAEPPRGL